MFQRAVASWRRLLVGLRVSALAPKHPDIPDEGLSEMSGFLGIALPEHFTITPSCANVARRFVVLWCKGLRTDRIRHHHCHHHGDHHQTIQPGWFREDFIVRWSYVV
jgi:hypothetical protein